MIIVYDKGLEPIGYFEEFESFQYSLKYQDAGEFTINALVTEKSLELLQLQHFIVYDDFCGLIETIMISTDSDGSQKIEATGRDLLGLLSYRAIISAMESVDVNGITLIKKILNENLISPDTAARTMPYLSLGDLTTTSETYTYLDIGANCLDLVKKIAQTCDVGIRVTHDISAKTFKFETYQPTDSDVIVGRKFDNVLTLDYTYSTVNGYSWVRASGTVSGSSDRYTLSASSEDGLTGMDRREYVVKYNNQKISTETKLKKQLLLIAKDNLNSIVKCLDIDVYNVDLSVGDNVRIIDDQWELDYFTPCTEKQISILDGEITTTYILGNDIKLTEVTY